MLSDLLFKPEQNSKRAARIRESWSGVAEPNTPVCTSVIEKQGDPAVLQYNNIGTGCPKKKSNRQIFFRNYFDLLSLLSGDKLRDAFIYVLAEFVR